MKIESITKYTYKGKEYFSLKEIKEEIHNTIGLEVLDKIVRVCPPQKHKDLFALLDVICSPDVRKTLVDCLTVTFEEEQELCEYGDLGADRTEEVNILDI